LEESRITSLDQNPEGNAKPRLLEHNGTIIIKNPHSLCTLVRYKYTMDAFNLSLYQRSNYKILQFCYSMSWLHATNVTASGLLPQIQVLYSWQLTGKAVSFQD